MPEDPSIVERKKAKAENVSYSEPVLIRSTDRMHFEIILHYVSHTSKPDELAAKLTYWKRTSSGFRSGFPIEFSLNHAEAKQLSLDPPTQSVKTGARPEAAPNATQVA